MENIVSVSSILFDKNKPGRYYVGLYNFGQPLTNNFSNGGLYLTEDNGKNWKKIYDSEVNLIKADNQSPRNIYIGTKFGIMTFVDTFTVTSVKEIKDEEKPTDFVLYQNYPNPFNPATIINFELAEETNVTIKVYDILGRVVTELVNGNLNEGKHKVNFNAANLTNGVYFYTIEAGSFRDTKKMILLK
jgi:hypothetical protein